MANEWQIITDKSLDDKRFLLIRDMVNKRDYSNYFPIRATNIEILSRFRLQVKEHRAELTARDLPKIDVLNFEATL